MTVSMRDGIQGKIERTEKVNRDIHLNQKIQVLRFDKIYILLEMHFQA